ncbi:MAG: sirohydrochlorin chelatase [Candidatus Accumulibacter sp.]|jgi:sirohydrochlorin cobaltochelatase|nr:sirohydrochlorin chelatase [Accumulibacter sp.]
MTRSNSTTLLLAGHGSRNPAGNREIEKFAALWRERRADRRIELCFIEYADVLLDEGLDRAARDAARVVLIPFILNAAGHVKMELPAALNAARLRHPRVEFLMSRYVGMGYEIHAILQDRLSRLMRFLDFPDPQTTGVVLLGRGSSDASANGEFARAARWVFESNDHELVDLAFTGITWPRLETVVQRQVRLGMTQICIVPVYLFTGVLIERIGAQVKRLERQYPQISFALGTHFGFDARIFDLLDARVAAVESRETLPFECDGCKYRENAEEAESPDPEHTATNHCGDEHSE